MRVTNLSINKKFVWFGLLIVLAMIVAGCAAPQTVTVTVEVTREVEVQVTPTPTAGPAVGVPFFDRWASSAHADTAAEAFVHWNEDDPAEVPTSCAKCHSTTGFRDFLAVDGGEFGVVDAAVPVGEVVTCDACHNDVTIALTSVTFPSGDVVMGLGDESRCMQCHQGRESGVSVNASIEEAGVTDEDAVNAELGFLNIHYYAAAATKYGTLAHGGYQYEGKTYDARFDHVAGADTCIGCHDPHTLQLKVETCQGCHENVESAEDFRDVRMQGSLVDYDGDGDTSEGIYYEVEGLQTMLYQAMQAYSADVAGSPLIYDTAAYPYFFIDTNANGTIDDGEATGDNRFASWTARLVKAAYNYQVSLKDPGAFAHGGKYIIELLYDSIDDLNSALSNPIDLAAANRIDDGHFAGSEEAFRHWDEDGAVPASCSKCHSASGLPLFLSQNVTIIQPTSNGFQCATCHDDLTTFTRYEVNDVRFPSGAVIDSEDPNTNLCMTCHQGRESTTSVNRLIQGLDVDTVGESLRFLNIHYFAAGATRFGGEAQGAYQYAGKEYVGFFEHVNAARGCTDCHSTHGLDVQVNKCADCHEVEASTEGLHSIRLEDTPDYDGDGDTTEGIAGEIETMDEALYTALQTYASEVAGTGILYSPASYPYFFKDSNGNGAADPDEINGGNGYNTWTPRLLQGAYNYQYVAKDPGAFAHNARYILQVLYDSLESLGADTSGMIRP